MSKFTFIKEPDPDNWIEDGDGKLTVEFDAFDLEHILQEFELFLKGSGFIFDGHLDIVQHETIAEGEIDLDDLDQWFGKRKETAKKLDEIAIMKADVSSKTDGKGEPYPGFGYSGKPVIKPQTDDE